MKYEIPPEIMKMYSHRTTGFHYLIRDPDTSSRERMELSSMRLRTNLKSKPNMDAKDTGTDSAAPFEE